jgi:hypothetical protein
LQTAETNEVGREARSPQLSASKRFAELSRYFR